MSGLLRRIKRSRTADAGEAPAAGQAAGPEGAPTTAEIPAAGSATAAAPRAAAPAVQADPNVPAGLEPAGPAPVTGRRSSLRRRLRYLRRARELMLRDLGGMLYEVHRTGGGDVAAHASVIGGKVERLASLDAEATAIAAALAAPRSEEVVFQPGVGGICQFCGELYGSAARFCSNCGSPTGSAVRATAAFAEPRHVPPMPKPPAAPPREAQPTRMLGPEPAAAKPLEPAKPLDDPAAKPADEPAATGAAKPADDAAAKDAAPAVDATEQPTEETVAPEQTAAPEQPAPEREGRNPFAGLSNGRPEDEAPPELSSGDPLASRETRP